MRKIVSMRFLRSDFNKICNKPFSGTMEIDLAGDFVKKAFSKLQMRLQKDPNVVLTIKFSSATLDPISFNNLRDIQKKYPKLKLDFSGVTLVGNFTGVDFGGCNLIKANLSGVNLSGANLTGTNLMEAFPSASNVWASMRFKSDLTGANLSGANLSGFNLTDFNLRGVNLTDANLTGTVSYGDDMTGANLTDAKLLRTLLTLRPLIDIFLPQSETL